MESKPLPVLPLSPPPPCRCASPKQTSVSTTFWNKKTMDELCLCRTPSLTLEIRFASSGSSVFLSCPKGICVQRLRDLLMREIKCVLEPGFFSKCRDGNGVLLPRCILSPVIHWTYLYYHVGTPDFSTLFHPSTNSNLSSSVHSSWPVASYLSSSSSSSSSSYHSNRTKKNKPFESKTSLQQHQQQEPPFLNLEPSALKAKQQTPILFVEREDEQNYEDEEDGQQLEQDDTEQAAEQEQDDEQEEL